MNRKIVRRLGHLLLAVLMLSPFQQAEAQVTTAVVSGRVTDAAGAALPGATVIAVHTPSGSSYGAAAGTDGRYTIAGMRAGGPYRITVSFVGMESRSTDGITLRLGETLRHDAELSESSGQLGAVVVAGRTDASKTGAADHIGATAIARMPSIRHGIADAIRLTPLVRVANDGAVYFAGTNNRYNSFQIDGVMNNDAYGLTTNGLNGGQAGTQPVSMETIEQLQVSVAPFDVRLSGFTGGSINAVTKSGSNSLHGSIYGFGNNQWLIGRRYRTADGGTSGRYTDQYEYQAGATLSGPLVKNRLFFFANYERANKTFTNPYAIGSAASRIDPEQAAAVLERLREMAREQGMNYGGNLNAGDVYAKSHKAVVKLDWNIAAAHKASFRWSYVSARQLNSASSAATLNASDFSYDFVSRTHSFVAELQSRFSNRLSNELRVSYVRVRDKRDPGAPFPMVQISNVGDGTLNLGNDRSSMANRLDQDIVSVTDNLTWYVGNHTLTAGTHNEFYSFANLFIQDAYGSYFFASPDSFFNGEIKQYRFAQANVAVTGDPRWAAAFDAGQIGFYVQDDFRVGARLLLTLGLRMDIPLLFDRPAENEAFNSFARQQGWDYRTNASLTRTPLFSPRMGFRWQIDAAEKYVLRGGIGIFTGRIPFVWLSNNFANTGVQLSAYTVNPKPGGSDLSFILDPSKQHLNADKLTASGSQTINVFDPDFRLPRTMRADLALDFELAGIRWTAEALYSKTLNNVLYKNLAVELTGKSVSETIPGLDFDRRPTLQRVPGAENFAGIYALTNTSDGYTCNFSLTGRRKFRFGLDAMASYTYTRSKVRNDGTGSVAQTNWQYNYTVVDPNDPELANSVFNVPHMIRAAVYYTKTWKKGGETTVGIVYTGSSGMPYTIYYNGDLNGDGGYNDLMFIPTDAQADQMIFAPSPAYTAEQQRANFKAWLGNDDYLRAHRGEYFRRYAANEAFEHHFDLHLSHRIGLRIGREMRGIEFSVDIVNIGNLFCKRWGRSVASNGTYNPVVYNNGMFQFLHDADYRMHIYDDYLSRWRGQVGIRLVF